MKKEKVVRYDLDRVYYLKEYQKAVAHAEQNIGISGVKEQLGGLKAEKKRYSAEVSALVEAERDNERQQYEHYEKWYTIANKAGVVLYGSIAAFFISIFIRNRSVQTILMTLGTLGTLGGCPAALVSVIKRNKYKKQYQKFVEVISGKIGSLGNAFTQICTRYYRAVDNLYLNSLDPMQRELVLMRREQAAQSQQLADAQRETQRLQKQLIQEQKKTRATEEELLAIEREREARRNSW